LQKARIDLRPVLLVAGTSDCGQNPPFLKGRFSMYVGATLVVALQVGHKTRPYESPLTPLF
jgi:hypothetical protein